MGFLKLRIILYERRWKSAPRAWYFSHRCPSLHLEWKKWMTVQFFLTLFHSFILSVCSCFRLSLSLTVITTVNMSLGVQPDVMSVQPRVNADINCLISHSVFIAQPLMKFKRCTKLPTPGCVTPDPGKWWGGGWRPTSVCKSSVHIWPLKDMMAPLSCSAASLCVW